jgi:hypothetical protein
LLSSFESFLRAPRLLFIGWKEFFKLYANFQENYQYSTAFNTPKNGQYSATFNTPSCISETSAASQSASIMLSYSLLLLAVVDKNKPVTKFTLTGRKMFLSSED